MSVISRIRKRALSELAEVLQAYRHELKGSDPKLLELTVDWTTYESVPEGHRKSEFQRGLETPGS